MDDFTVEVIKQISAGNTAKAKECIDNILASKTNAALEQQKQEVAQNFFNKYSGQPQELESN